MFRKNWIKTKWININHKILMPSSRYQYHFKVKCFEILNKIIKVPTLFSKLLIPHNKMSKKITYWYLFHVNLTFYTFDAYISYLDLHKTNQNRYQNMHLTISKVDPIQCAKILHHFITKHTNFTHLSSNYANIPISHSISSISCTTCLLNTIQNVEHITKSNIYKLTLVCTKSSIT